MDTSPEPFGPPDSPPVDTSQPPTRVPAGTITPLSPAEREWQARNSAVRAYSARAAIAARYAHQLWPDARDMHNPALPIVTPIAEPEPAAQPVNGAKLLDDVTALIDRYLALPAPSAATMALWALHAWAPQAHAVSPRLALVSPEPHAGKTTALRVLALLTPRPLIAEHARAAPLLRVMDFTRPTLLFDEAERWLLTNRVLRAAVASGHARDARTLKESNNVFELPAFSAFCPCAIALSGRLPDDLGKRSIAIRMTPMLPDEKRTRLNPASPPPEIEALRAQCVRWSLDHLEALSNAEPDMPAKTSNAARDLWRPLIAIADAAGGDWPEHARAAALALSAETRSLSAELLHDIRDAFTDGDRMSTQALLTHLTSDAERPWQRMPNGRPLDAHELSRRLAAFHIRPRNIRFGDGIARGYMARDFGDAFARYLTPRVYTPYEDM